MQKDFITIVDDQEDIQETLKVLLEEGFDIEVKTYDSLGEMLTDFDELKALPRVVICDIHMPTGSSIVKLLLLITCITANELLAKEYRRISIYTWKKRNLSNVFIMTTPPELAIP